MNTCQNCGREVHPHGLGTIWQVFCRSCATNENCLSLEHDYRPLDGLALQCVVCGRLTTDKMLKRHEAAKQALRDVQAVEARLDSLKKGAP